MVKPADVAQAISATVGPEQMIASFFGRPAFTVPRYQATLPKIDRVRTSLFGKGSAAQIDDGDGFPTFAELLVGKRLRVAGWSSVWASAYGGFRFIAAWPWDAPAPFVDDPPPAILRRLTSIAEFRRELDGTLKCTFDGIPDVIAWRGEDILMIECKRAGEDSLRPGQQKWMHAAVENRPPPHLGIFEWRFSRPRARRCSA